MARARALLRALRRQTGEGPRLGGALMQMAGGMMGPREHQQHELLARARAAGVVRADLVASDMPALFCALASVVQAGGEGWRRYLELLLDGLRPAAAARGS